MAAGASTPEAPLDAARAARIGTQLVHCMRVNLAPSAAPVRACAPFLAGLFRACPELLSCAACAPQAPPAVRIPAAVLRDASPGGGMQRVLSAAAAFLASAGDVDLAAPESKAQARRCCARAGRASR